MISYTSLTPVSTMRVSIWASITWSWNFKHQCIHSHSHPLHLSQIQFRLKLPLRRDIVEDIQSAVGYVPPLLSYECLHIESHLLSFWSLHTQNQLCHVKACIERTLSQSVKPVHTEPFLYHTKPCIHRRNIFSTISKSALEDHSSDINVLAFFLIWGIIVLIKHKIWLYCASFRLAVGRQLWKQLSKCLH